MSHLRNRHLSAANNIREGNKFPAFKSRNPSPSPNNRQHHSIKGSERVRTEPDYHIKTLYNQ